MGKTGEVGEKFLSLLASQANITCNKAIEDNFGWDFNLQFTLINSKPDIPLDKKNIDISVLVQVKTTKENKTTFPIKLSNWEHLINTPIPTFIMFIKLNNEDQPENVYLSHISEKWMNVVLQKLRTTKKKTNKVSIIYKPETDEQVENINGQLLKRKILECIGENYQEYCKNKMSKFNSLGYGKITNEGKFSINGKLEEIVDFSIGLKPEIKVNNLIIKEDIRFGIPGIIKDINEASITIKPEGQDVDIKIYNEENMNIILKGKLFTPFIMFKQIPEEQIKFRIVFDLGEFIINSKKSLLFNFKFDFLKFEQKIRILEPIAFALIILSKKEYNPRHDIIFKNTNKMTFEINPFNDNDLPNSLINIAGVIDSLFFISKFIDIDIDELINLNLLIKQKFQIFETRAFFDTKFYDNHIMLDFSLKEKIDLTKKIAIPRIIAFEYNNKFVIIVGVYTGTAEFFSEAKDEYKFKYKCNVTPKIIKTLLTTNYDSKKYKSDYIEVLEKYSNDPNFQAINSLKIT